MKKKNQIKESFDVDPYAGAAAALSGISKPGYHIIEIKRKGSKATVTFEKDQK